MAADRSAMQGKWKVIEIDNQGAVYKSGGKGAAILIEKNFMTDLDGEGKPCGKVSMKLDPSKSPKKMDLTIVFNKLFPDTKGKTLQSLYQIDGDTLKIAATVAPFRGYPKGFKTSEGCHFLVTTYKRVKP